MILLDGGRADTYCVVASISGLEIFSNTQVRLFDLQRTHGGLSGPVNADYPAGGTKFRQREVKTLPSPMMQGA